LQPLKPPFGIWKHVFEKRYNLPTFIYDSDPSTKILSFTYYTPIQVMDINPIGNQILKANDMDAKILRI